MLNVKDDLNLIFGKNYKCLIDLPAINSDKYNQFKGFISKLKCAGILVDVSIFSHSRDISCCFIEWKFEGLSTICQFGVCDMDIYHRLKYDIIDT